MIIRMRSLLMFVCETGLSLWFFRHVQLGRTKWTWGKLLALAVCLLFLLYLYITPFLFNFWLRFVYRSIIYLILARYICSIRFAPSVFFSVFLTVILTACQNIFSIPLVYEILRMPSSQGTSIPGTLVTCCIEFLFRAAVLKIIFKTVPLHHVQSPSPAEWFVLSLTALCEVYVKQTLFYFQGKSGQELALTTFPLLLQIVQLCFLVYFERYVDNQRIQKEVQFQELTNQYRLQSLDQRRQSDEALRMLNHDMKNHLRVMRQLSANAKNDQLSAYINHLLQDAEISDHLVETGNPLLNGLLTDKVTQAARYRIELDVLMDFSGITFLNDWTLCTIFGNLTDNAIEACQRVADPDSRRIRIRSSMVAGQLQITIANTCTGTVRLFNGLPVSTKEHPQTHGIGLRNVRRTLKQYDGVLVIDTSTPGWFLCTVQIPVPEENTSV